MSVTGSVVKGKVSQASRILDWVAVKELKLSYHNGFPNVVVSQNRETPI